MSKAEIKHVPDVPEIRRYFGRMVHEFKDALEPHMIGKDMSLILNALMAITIEFAMQDAQTKEERFQIVDTMFETIKRNLELME